MRQLLTESLVLARPAARWACLSRTGALQLLIAIAPENLPRLADVHARLARRRVRASPPPLVVGVLFGLAGAAVVAARADRRPEGRRPHRHGAHRRANVMVVARWRSRSCC